MLKYAFMTMYVQAEEFKYRFDTPYFHTWRIKQNITVSQVISKTIFWLS